MQLHDLPLCVRRGSQGDRSKAGSAPRPGREGYCTALLQEAGAVLLRKCYDIYPCTRLALQVQWSYLCKDFPMEEARKTWVSLRCGSQCMVMDGAQFTGAYCRLQLAQHHLARFHPLLYACLDRCSASNMRAQAGHGLLYACLDRCSASNMHAQAGHGY